MCGVFTVLIFLQKLDKIRLYLNASAIIVTIACLASLSCFCKGI